MSGYMIIELGISVVPKFKNAKSKAEGITQSAEFVNQTIQ